MPVQEGCCTALCWKWISHVLYIEVLCRLLLSHLQVKALFTSSTKAAGTHYSLRLPLSPISYSRQVHGDSSLTHFRTNCTKFSLRHWNCIIYVCVNFIRLFSFLFYASFFSYLYLCLLPFKWSLGCIIYTKTNKELFLLFLRVTTGNF